MENLSGSGENSQAAMDPLFRSLWTSREEKLATFSPVPPRRLDSW